MVDLSTRLGGGSELGVRWLNALLGTCNVVLIYGLARRFFWPTAGLAAGAILAVASSRETAVVYEGEIAIRHIMKMTISADHRLIDGALAARFTGALSERLSDIRNLLL